MQNIFTAFQNSFCFDDLRGNFTLAQNLADHMTAEAQPSDDALTKATAHYWQGVVGTARGNLRAAESHFEQYQKHLPKDVNVQLLTLAWQQRLMSLCYDRTPDGILMTYSLEGGLRHDKMAYYIQNLTEKHAIQYQAAPEYQALARVLEFYRSAAQFYYFAQFTRLNGTVIGGLDTNTMTSAVATACQAFYTEGVNLQNGQLCGWAYWVLADLQYRAGLDSLAAQNLNAARQTYTSQGDTHGLALCAMAEGDVVCAPLSGVAAMNMYLQEIEFADNRVMWQIAQNEGNTVHTTPFRGEGLDLDTAEAHYREVEQALKTLDAPRLKAALHLRFAYCHFLKNQLVEALDFIEKAIVEARACSDDLLVQTATTHQIVYLIAADKTAAVQDLAQSVGAWGDKSGSFSFAIGLGQMLCRHGRYWFEQNADAVRSIRAARAARILFTALGAVANHWQAAADEAHIYVKTNDRESAFNLWQQIHEGLQKYRADKPADINQRLLTRQATIETDLLNNLSAVQESEALRRIMAQVQRSLPADARTITIETITKLSMEGADGAEISRLATDYSRYIVLTSAQVQAPLLEAKTAQYAGETARANRLYAEALTATEDCLPSFRYLQEATIYGHLKDYDKALAIYDKHLDILQDPNNGNAIAAMMADANTANNPTLHAEVRLGAIRQAAQNIAMFTRLRAYSRAEAAVQVAENIGGSDWYMVEDLPYKILTDVGWLYEGLKRYDTALDYYRKAIDNFDEMRQKLTGDAARVSFAGGSAAGYLFFQSARCALVAAKPVPHLQDVAQVDFDLLNQSFQFAEQGKARALTDLLSNTAAHKLSGDSPTMRQWRQLGTQVSAQKTLLSNARNEPQTTPQMIQDLEQKIKNLEVDYTQAEQKMVAENPRFYEAIRRDTPVLDAEAVFDKLPQGTVFISYLFYDDDFMAWCLTADRRILYSHRSDLNSHLLNRQILKLHTACIRREDPSVLAAEMTAIFIEPFAEAIRAAERIVISPFGTANRLPFQILPFDGLPLGLQYDLSYLPNASLLQFLDKKNTADHPLSILTIGNPANMSYRENPLEEPQAASNLPAAEAEARYIAQLFADNTCLTGADATEDAFNQYAPHADILHLATHGMTSETAPLNSAILLANGEAVTVDELIGLNIKARLVTLSACETALGNTTEGGDVLGLSRGLLAAGAQAVVVSLWQVNDMMTSVLMKAFYVQISKGTPPARALRLAQKHIYETEWTELTAEAAQSARGIGRAYKAELGADRGRLPYYWAAFVVIAV